MWVAFANAKANHIFSAKILAYNIYLSFNDTLTNDIVSFEQLGPGNAMDYSALNIFLKDIFCLEFYLKWKHFVLIDHNLSETICLFYFCVCSQIFTYLKINFTAKNWPDLCNFYNKVIFLDILYKEIFFTFFFFFTDF